MLNKFLANIQELNCISKIILINFPPNLYKIFLINKKTYAWICKKLILLLTSVLGCVYCIVV